MCEAFPESIPDRFLNPEGFYTAPVDGDNGIQFEPEDVNDIPDDLRQKAGL